MSHEITNALTSHPAATAVAGVTVTSGITNWFDVAGDGLGLIAVIMGITLTTILIKKHLFELKVMKDREQRRRKEDNIEECKKQ